MKVLSVVGARPQFVKLAPVSHALAAAGHEHVIVHSGQHYDPLMSEVFFEDLGIPAPDVNLEVGSGGHGAMTGTVLERLDPVLAEYRPDWVLCYGDTNTTLAAAICGAKLHLRTAHLEGGLRSFNRAIPEEINRVLADHASDLVLVPTQLALDLATREGLGERSVLVGDVMTDILLETVATLADAPVPFEVEGPYVLVTIHRAGNTDDPAQLDRILRALRALPIPAFLPAHPRLVARAAEAGLELGGGSLHVIEPLSYPQMLAALMSARAVVTDSGGVQKEAYLLGVPCTCILDETPWQETLDSGWNVLDPRAENLTALAMRAGPDPSIPRDAYGDGNAAAAVVRALEERLRG